MSTDTTSLLTLPERIERRTREALAHEALLKLSMAGRTSRGSTVWDVPMNVLARAASMHLVDLKSGTDLFETLADDLVVPVPGKGRKKATKKAISSRAFARWLEALRKTYEQIVKEQLVASSGEAALFKARGDLPLQASLFVGLFVERVGPAFAKMDWDVLSNSDKHVTLRAISVVNDSLKVWTEAKFKEAQTDKVREALEAIKRQRDGAKNPEAEATLDEVLAILSAATGIPLADQRGGIAS